MSLVRRLCRNLAEGGCLLSQFHFKLSLLFGPCRLLEFTLAGPQIRQVACNHNDFVPRTNLGSQRHPQNYEN